MVRCRFQGDFRGAFRRPKPWV